MMPPRPLEARDGPSAFRSFVVLVLVVGLFGTGLYYFIRGSQKDATIQEQIEISLTKLGHVIWQTGTSFDLATTTDDEAKDLADLPRIVMAIKTAAGANVPRVKVVEGDPPPGKGTASHQIVYLFNDRPLLIIRVRLFPDTGRVEFLGEANRAVPSRREFESQSGANKAGVSPPPAVPPIPPPLPLPVPEAGTPK